MFEIKIVNRLAALAPNTKSFAIAFFFFFFSFYLSVFLASAFGRTTGNIFILDSMFCCWWRV